VILCTTTIFFLQLIWGQSFKKINQLDKTGEILPFTTQRTDHNEEIVGKTVTRSLGMRRPESTHGQTTRNEIFPKVCQA